MDSSDFSSDESPEISQLRQQNAQLVSDYAQLQNQFNEMVNSCPKIEDLNKENNKIKKQLVEANIIIEDYKKRLTISVESSNDFAAKVNNSQLSAENLSSAQIAHLRDQIENLEKSKNTEIEELKRTIKKNEMQKSNTEKENSVMKNQLVKIINLSKNYFHVNFQSADEICELLMHPNPQSTMVSESQRSTLQQLDEKTEKKDDKKYKTLYNNEKAKRKALELDILRLKQSFETDTLSKNQQEDLINDMKRKHQNELKQVEADYKQEIAKLISQQQLEQKKYHTMSSQTNSIAEPNSSAKNDEEYYSDEENNNEKHEQIVVGDTNQEVIVLRKQVDDLSEQLKKTEEKLHHQREKNKENLAKVEKMNKAFKIHKKRSSTVIKQLEQQINDNNNENSNNPKNKKDIQANDKSSKEANKGNPENEIKGLRKSLQIFGDLTENQQNDINKLTDERDKLIAILNKQNQYLEKSESFVEQMKNSNKQLIKNGINQGSKDDTDSEDSNKKKKIDWDFSSFPDSLVQIMKPIAENECLPLETRIRHVMGIVAKWSDNLDGTYKDNVSKNQEQREASQKKYNLFITSILSALGERGSIPENNIIEKVEKLSQDNLLLQQKANELDLKARNVLNAKEENEFMINNKLQQVVKECNAANKRKAIELHDCKAAFLECQRKAKDDLEKLQETNTRIRAEMDDLQKAHDKLHEQHDSLVEQINNMKVSHEDEVDGLRAELEALHLQSINRNDEYQKKVNELRSKEKEIRNLKQQLGNAQQTIGSFEESSRMTIDDINQSKQKLEKYKTKKEEQMAAVINEKEKEKAKIEKRYSSCINELNQKIKELQEQLENNVQSKEAAEKIKQTEEMIGELESKVVKLTYQIQQDSIQSKSQIEAYERANKLLEVQNCAKLMALETSYSLKCDEIKQTYEMANKDLLSFIVQQFKPYYDVKKELNNDTVKVTIKKIKGEIERQKKRENAIRSLVAAKDGQSTEDALTDMIISHYPQIVANNQKTK